MDINGFLSGVFVGLIVGALARIVIRNNEPIGCLLTIIIGVVGATIGTAIGHNQGWGFWLTFAVQILIAALIVALFTFLVRPRR